MARPPDLWPARARPRSWLVVAINLAIHSLLFLVTIRPWLPPLNRLARPPVAFIPLPSEGPRAVEMVYLPPAEGQGDGQRPGVALTRPPVPGAVPQVETREPAPELVPAEQPADTGTVPTAAPPAAPGPGARLGIARIGPARGQGTLWVQPLPLPPRQLAQRLARTHMELVDSAVSAIVQAYIDSVVASPTLPGSALPSWTTQIEGQTFGLDSRYIYLGPLKIPTAILALLPLPGGNNADLQEGRRLAAIREDLQYAVRRAETMDDFRKAIKEIRERREREREFERNRRLTPPAVPPDTSRRP